MTEEDPIKLFQELIKASSNGEVPAHLIKRLKELEGKQKLENFNLEVPEHVWVKLLSGRNKANSYGAPSIYSINFEK